MSRRSHVERGEEYVDGPVVRVAWQDRRTASQAGAWAIRHNALDALPELADALGIDWPAVRTAKVPAGFQPGRRERLSYAALQAPFRPALWAVCAALIATATTTHLTKPKGGAS